MAHTVAIPRRPDAPSPEDYIIALARTIVRLNHLHSALEEDGDNTELQESVLADIELLLSLREGILNGISWSRPETLQ
jgi:hypothetical protein